MPERAAVGRALGWAGAAVAAGLLILDATAYGTLAAARLSAAHPLVWVEPIFFRSALEFFQGGSAYPSPSLDYTAPIYNPGIGWLGGALFRFCGPGYPLLRAVPFVAFVLLVIGVAAWSLRETRDVGWALGIALAGLTTSVSCQFVTSSVNADLPCHALGLAAFLWIVQSPGSRRASWGGALLVGLAFVFKQNAVVYAVVCALALARTPRRALEFVAGAGLVMLLFEGLLAWRSDGWSWIYTIQIPFDTGAREGHRFWWFWVGRNGLAVGAFAIALPIVVALDGGRRHAWLALAAGTFAVSYAGFVKVGGAANSLLPSYWGGFVLATVAFSRVRDRVPEGWPRAVSSLTAVLVLTLFAHAQLDTVRERATSIRAARLGGDPIHPRHVRFEARLRDAVSSVEGRVFVGARFASWWDLGRPFNTHQVPILEGTDRARVFDLASFEQPLAERRYAAMFVWDHPFDPSFDAILQRHYRRVERLGTDPLAGHRVDRWEPIPNPPSERRYSRG